MALFAYHDTNTFAELEFPLLHPMPPLGSAWSTRLKPFSEKLFNAAHVSPRCDPFHCA